MNGPIEHVLQGKNNRDRSHQESVKIMVIALVFMEQILAQSHQLGLHLGLLMSFSQDLYEPYWHIYIHQYRG